MNRSLVSNHPRNLLIGILFGLIGFGLNWFKLELFFGVDFLFGSIVTMVALQRYGLLAGTSAALIATSATIFHWHHPWVMVIFTAEVLLVHQLNRRKHLNLLNADILYWFTAGLLLVWLFYHQIMGFSPLATLVIALKQGINGIFNTLLATAFCLSPWVTRQEGQHQKPSLRELLFVSLAGLVLLPTLGYAWFSITSEFKQNLTTIQGNTSRFSRIIALNTIDLWFIQKQQQMENLAAVISDPDTVPQQQLQQTLEKLQKNKRDVYRQMILDKNSITLAFVPKVDEQGNPTIGLNLGNRPYMQQVMTPPYPVITTFFMGQIGSPGPRLSVVAPIHDQGGHYQGAVLSVYKLDELQLILQRLAGSRPLTITILDPEGRVVVSSNKELKSMEMFKLPPQGSLKPLKDGLVQWIPDPQPGIGVMKCWLRSFYYKEEMVSSLPGWKLVVQWSLKPVLLQTNQQVSRILSGVAVVLLIALALAHYFSGVFANMFSRLEQITRTLPQRILDGETIIWPAATLREVEGLTENFQHMSVSLQQHSLELKTLNENLEQRVQDRTSQLLESEERLRTLINLIPDIICLKDGEGRWLLANQYDLELFGLMGVDYQGKTDIELAPFSPFCRAALMTCKATDELAWQAGDLKRCEETIPRPDGSSITFDIIKLPVFQPDGSRKALVVVGRDITARKLTEKALQDASEAKMQFLANMSHEIRTPMNGVIGMAGLLEETGLNNEQCSYLQTIRTSGNLLLAIISDILDFSKMESGRLELEQAPFELKEILKELVSLEASQAQAKGLVLQLRLDPEEPCCLVGDVTRLRQILLNLLNNAIKFTEYGSVSLQARLEPYSDDQMLLQCQVVDTGIGIPENRLDILFDPFTQADSSTTRTHGGTGLGLAICRQLTHLMGGSVSVESRLEQGTTFTVALPFTRCSAEDRALLHQEKLAEPPVESCTARVLVVEDNTVNLQVACTILEKRGHTVVTATNGREALSMLRLMPVDMVLMDCQMPIMDGFEATRRIRAGEAGQTNALIPIIAMTAHAFVQDKERSLLAGMDAYLTKPVQVNTLLHTLDLWYGRSHGDRHVIQPAETPLAPPEQSGPVLVFDPEELLSRLDNDKELAESSISIFLEGIDASLSALKQAVENRNIEDVTMQAHGLKGAALNSSAGVLAEVARQLEFLARDGVLRGAEQLILALEQEVVRYRHELQRAGWL
jgi:PAS domain S-box-containing protein